MSGYVFKPLKEVYQGNNRSIKTSGPTTSISKLGSWKNLLFAIKLWLPHFQTGNGTLGVALPLTPPISLSVVPNVLATWRDNGL